MRLNFKFTLAQLEKHLNKTRIIEYESKLLHAPYTHIIKQYVQYIHWCVEYKTVNKIVNFLYKAIDKHSYWDNTITK